jgi:hypothetical protein
VNKISAGTLILHVIATLVVALAAWGLLGYLATAPLGAIYGWSGHPSIPAAPMAVYVGLYLIVLPAICLFGAWTIMRWIEARIRGRRRHLPE